MYKQQWFPFYHANWRDGTRGMTPAQKGIYIDIIAELYDCENALELERKENPITGKLEKYCFKTLARRFNTRTDFLEKRVNELIKMKKISIIAGYITQKKVGEEIHKREMISTRKRENAQKRWNLHAENVKDFNKYR